MMINKYITGGVALLILFLSWQLKASFTENGELTNKLETQTEQTRRCATANGTSLVAIADLRETIKTMVAERKADTERREQVLVQREEELRQARTLASKLQRERQNEINTNAKCKDLLSLDLSGFCPATFDQLRVRSRGGSSDGDGAGGSAGGGVPGATEDPD